MGKVPEDYKGQILCPYLKKNGKRHYRLFSLTLIPGKILDCNIKSSICKYLEDNKVRSNRQHGFVESKSCFINLISFYDKDRHCRWGGEIDGMHVKFRKAFVTGFHDIRISKLRKYDLVEITIRWICKWLDDCVQRIVINGSL